jgi:O-methyltransferase
MQEHLIKLIKELQFRSPLRRYFFPRYTYNFTPAQLAFLVRSLSEVRDVPGAVAEIGCADGGTTLFLNRHMDAEAIEKSYFAVDTFAGFVPADVQYELTHRQKAAAFYTGFRINNRRWFDGTMRRNGVTRVQSIRADVNLFDLRTLGPLCFALLDVDLYRPMKKALHELYEVLNPGGIVVVDDCNADDILFDGSEQAYREFASAHGFAPEVVHGKLGLVRKSVARLQQADSARPPHES